MALTFTHVVQDIDHGGTNNNDFEDKALTYYDETEDKIVSVDGTEVTEDSEENVVLHVDRLDSDITHVDTFDADNATVNESLEVNGNTTINGDLIVNGTKTEEHTADLYVGSDTITLRDGASTSLTNGEYSGIIVNKYNGTNGLGLVTTNDGTLKVGELDLVYCYTTSDTESAKYGHYYSDKDLENEISIPSGKTFIKEQEDSTTHLVKGYYVNNDDTQPIMTRDEESNLTDKGVVYWDETDKMSKTSTITKDELENMFEVSDISGDDKIEVSHKGTLLQSGVDYSDVSNDFEDSGDTFEYDGDTYAKYDITSDVELYIEYNSVEKKVQYIGVYDNDICVVYEDDTKQVITDTDLYWNEYERSGTQITLNENNKIYHTTTTPNPSDYEDGNYVTIPNAIEGNCIAITDEIAEGDYNIPTSDALFNYLEGWSPHYDGSWSINNWQMSWTDD